MQGTEESSRLLLNVWKIAGSSECGQSVGHKRKFYRLSQKMQYSDFQLKPVQLESSGLIWFNLIGNILVDNFFCRKLFVWDVIFDILEPPLLLYKKKLHILCVLSTIFYPEVSLRSGLWVWCLHDKLLSLCWCDSGWLFVSLSSQDDSQCSPQLNKAPIQCNWVCWC